MAEEKKGLDPATKVSLITGVTTGLIWTAVAGTMWQWAPIAAALTVVYYTEKLMINAGKEKGGKQ